MRLVLSVVGLLALTSGALTSGTATAQSYSCDPAACQAPSCRCASTTPPGGISPANLPQLIVLTFDDGINSFTHDAITQSLTGLTNPNGCPVPATFFLTTRDATPSSVCQLYRSGHEIANHTHEHNTSTASSESDWRTQIQLMASQARAMGVPSSSIRGFRSPFLQFNADLFSVMNTEGLLYDSSVGEAPMGVVSSSTSQMIWPYTLDNGFGQRCWTFSPGDGACPNVRYPGLWEIPLWTLTDSASGIDYTMDPAPFIIVDQRIWVRQLLTDNYDARRRGNRAPLGLFLHPGWVSGYPDRVRGMRDFLSTALRSGDTWMVTMADLVEFMKDPQTSAQMMSWTHAQCPNIPVDCAMIGDAGVADSGARSDATIIDGGSTDATLVDSTVADASQVVDSGSTSTGRDDGGIVMVDSGPRARPIVDTRCECGHTSSDSNSGWIVVLAFVLALRRRSAPV